MSNMTPEYEAFLAQEAQDEWPPRPEILSALRTLLIDPSAPAADVARACVSRAIAEANPTPEYGDLWSPFIGAVERFPEYCDRFFHHPLIENVIQDCDEDEEDFYNMKRDEALEIIDVRALNGFVSAAAVWLEYCGKEIYEKQGSLGREIRAYDKWKGSESWSKERWAFWKERFTWISAVTALDRKTRRIAKNVVESMRRIEQGDDGVLE